MTIDEPVSDFGSRLKRLRLERNLTLDMAAELTGISRTALHRYENNLQDPLFSNVISLAKGYNVTLDYLAGFDSDCPTVRLYGLNQKQRAVIWNFLENFIEPLKSRD